MGDKTQLERIMDLETELRELRALVKAFVTISLSEQKEKKRGNPNWVKRGEG
jgi:hypothetical protein